MMKIIVEHDVPSNPLECCGDGDFWGKPVCKYHVKRDRAHGRKAPIERDVPKCTLFDCWLEKPYLKCEACRKACEGRGCND